MKKELKLTFRHIFQRTIWIIVGVAILTSAVVLIREVSQPTFEQIYPVQAATAPWRVLDLAPGTISLEFPGSPEHFTELITIDDTEVMSHVARTILADGTSYSVRTITYPESVDLADFTVNVARVIKALLADSPEMELESAEQRTSNRPAPTIDVRLRDQTGSQQFYRFVLVTRTLVLLGAAGPAGTNPAADRLFQSLEISGSTAEEP